MLMVNLIENPINISDIAKIVPIYCQPFLPIEEKYLTRILLVLKNGKRINLDVGEWIHPEGISMGKISIAADTFQVVSYRIKGITACVKNANLISGFKIALTDGGMYIITEGMAEVTQGASPLCALQPAHVGREGVRPTFGTGSPVRRWCTTRTARGTPRSPLSTRTAPSA